MKLTESDMPNLDLAGNVLFHGTKVIELIPKGYFTCQKTKNPSRRGVLRVVPPGLEPGTN